jgi:protein O-mannosyl-transferase
LPLATFAVEFEFFGLNSHISHFINVLLYSLTCLLIFIILSKLLEKYPKQKWYNTIPFLATILFIAHPVHTEVVANIKSRDEILSLLFSLLTLWVLWKYLDSGNIKFMILCAVLYSLALISKETSLVFILIIPLTFYFFTNIPLKKILTSLIPLLIIIIIFIVIRQIMISHKVSESLNTNDIMNNSFGAMNLSEKYATITYTLGLYIKLLFIPHPLTWDYYPYHIPIMEWSDIAVIISLVIYLLLMYFAFTGLKSKSYYSWCIFLFLLPLFPTSNILFPVGAFMAERFVYSSSLGFTLLISYLIVVKPNNFFRTIFTRPLLLVIILLFLYSIKTIIRNMAWKNGVILTETDVKTSVNSIQSNSAYGEDLYNKAEQSKDPDERTKYYELALKYCEKAYTINPGHAKINFLLGDIYLKFSRDLDKSAFYLNNAMNMGINDFQLYNNLGFCYGSTKQFARAIEVFEKARKIYPEDILILKNLALANKYIGDTIKAATYSEKVKEMENNNNRK